MAAAPEEEENELNFSDIDSDDESDDKPVTVVKSMIAHKDMSRFVTNEPQAKNTIENQDFEAISPPNEEKLDENSNDEPAFEPISPVSDPGNNFEAISPPMSPSNINKEESGSKFENISDDEDDKEEEEIIPEGKFSPVQESDNELNFDDESSNDSGYQIVKPATKTVTENTIDETETSEKKDDIDDDDIEAPMPSPFSDLGDPDDMPGTEGGIIEDILNGGSHEQHFVAPIDKEISSEKDKSNENLIENKTISTDERDSTDKTGTESKENDESNTVDDTEVIETHTDVEISQTTEQVSIETSEQTAETISDETGTKEDTEAAPEVAPEEAPDDDEDLIADIFGDSDDEEEFEGFAEEDLLPEKKSEDAVEDEEDEEEEEMKQKHTSSKDQDSSDDEILQRNEIISDFDIMMQKKKEMNRIKRMNSKKDYDIISDNDDIIIAMISKMKDAAEEDRMLNQCGKAATKKMKMLPTITRHLWKADLQHIFIDSGILPAIKEWLTPLPDHALPHINIRKTFLKILLQFPALDKGALKVSGIGRAVMLLFKHPKETTENKRIAGKIISSWARPIFNVSTNFQDMSREEREDRDKANLPEAKRRRLSSGAESNRRTLDDDTEAKPRKPGDKGWIGRARVPMPSHRDYVNRPQSKVDSYNAGSVGTKKVSRYDKQMRKMKDKKGGGSRKAVGVSLNGSKLAL